MFPFQHNGLVNESLEVFESSHRQLNSQLIVETLQELLLPGCICVDIIWSIAIKLVEFLYILRYCATSLAQAAELLLLQSHGACRDMCGSKRSLKLLPSDGVDGIGHQVVVPPCSGRTLQQM